MKGAFSSLVFMVGACNIVPSGQPQLSYRLCRLWVSGASALLLLLDRGPILSVRIIITLFHDKPILASLSNKVLKALTVSVGKMRRLLGLVGKYFFKVSFCNN